jgi:hypothetical protein
MLMTVIVQVQVQLRISYCVLFSESEPKQMTGSWQKDTNVNVVITKAVAPY